MDLTTALEIAVSLRLLERAAKLICCLILFLIFQYRETFGRLLEAMIFVYVRRPFEVGDLCEIEGVEMIVKDINIKTTNFLSCDNQKISYPNEVLSALPISCFNRTDMRDSIDFRVHASTSMKKLATVRERVITFMEGKKDCWLPGAKVVMKDEDDMHMLNMSIRFRYTMNFHGIKIKNDRRKMVVQELDKALKELNIEHVL